MHMVEAGDSRSSFSVHMKIACRATKSIDAPLNVAPDHSKSLQCHTFDRVSDIEYAVEYIVIAAEAPEPSIKVLSINPISTVQKEIFADLFKNINGRSIKKIIKNKNCKTIENRAQCAQYKNAVLLPYLFCARS